MSAALVMGSWAALANHAHGSTAAWTAGLVQASASTLVTFGLKSLMDAGASRLTGMAALLLPPLVASVLVLVLLVAAHELAGTRELWRTIAVPFVASFTYAWTYSALLSAKSRTPARPSPDRNAILASSDLRASDAVGDRPARSGLSDGNAAGRQHAVVVPHGTDRVAGSEYIEGMAVESRGALGESVAEEPHPRGGSTEVP